MVENVGRHPNIEAAIRRSRAVRAAGQSRRRRSLAIAVILAAALGGGGILSLDAFMGGNAVHAAVVEAKSLADLLSQRSPGQRTAAQLTKTKHSRALAKMRVLPHPTLTERPTELASVLMPAPPEVSLDLAPPLPMASLIGPPPIAGLVVPPSGGGGVSPPGGGGGVSPPGTETFPNEPHVPVQSAVPEPGSWALMLLGFGLIGWRSRRSRPSLLTA